MLYWFFQCKQCKLAVNIHISPPSWASLPSQIKSVDERLASRLTWAGAFDLQLPKFEDKCAILRAKAELMGAEIEPEAIEYIAENVNTNIRDLEGEFSTILLKDYLYIEKDYQKRLLRIPAFSKWLSSKGRLLDELN